MGRPRVHADDAARRHAQNERRKVAREAHRLHFIGVDGEGTGEWQDHRYVLLGASTEQIENGDGLEFSQIMSFLWETFLRYPHSVFCGFFLGYDFTMWLRNLPEERARMLLTDSGKRQRARIKSGANKTPFPVSYAGWEFDILGMKRFKLRKQGARQWMHICDAGPFFQTSLVKAIDPKRWKEPVVTDGEYEIIVEGKRSRASAVLGNDMRLYNRLENDVLARLLGRLNEGFTKAGIKLRKDQWFGPGQAAQAWLGQQKELPASKVLRDVVPAKILDLGRMTYYGGWFEIFAHGIVPGTSWEYDINSAYPHIASNLPCLLHGTWKASAGLRGDRLVICHARVSGSDSHIGSMLHRLPDGNIRRPHWTQGYYWASELLASKRAGLIDTIDVLESWEYVACDCHPPLRGLAGLYQERLRVGKDTAAGKSYRLVYNSAYGKFAQSVGDPRYANALYASLITSGCRTMILNAIATHPLRSDAVLMAATDGVYFTQPHPGLPISEKLGEWDVQEKENLTLFKPGVYWDDKARERIARGDDPGFKSRGVSNQGMAGAIQQIDDHYRRWPERYPAERDPMGTREGWHPKVTFSAPFAMITAVQALQRNKWHLAGRLGHEPLDGVCDGCAGAHLTQDADPVVKRHSGWFNEERGIWWSRPYPDGGHPFESAPYEKRFGIVDPDEYGVNPDGSVLEGFSWLLHDK